MTPASGIHNQLVHIEDLGAAYTGDRASVVAATRTLAFERFGFAPIEGVQ